MTKIQHGAYTCGNKLRNNNGWHLTFFEMIECDELERMTKGTDMGITKNEEPKH